MDQGGVASRQKKAHRLRAHLAFLDETGVLMAPLVRRSWAPRGQTPILYQRTNSHKKVSVIGSLAVAPRRDRVRFYFRLHANRNVNTQTVADFLNHLTRQLRGPIVLLWDCFGPHKSRKMNAYLGDHPNIHPEFFPPYAPELNPVEYVWSYLKNNPLANYAVFEVDELADFTRRNGLSVQNKQSLLRSFIRHSPLSLRLK